MMHLALLAVLLLQLAPDQQVELLVGAAELDVGLHRHRVVALHQRVQQLVHRDRLLLAEALGEVVALQELRDGIARGEPDHALRAERARPRRVEQDLGLVRIEDLEHLVPVGPGVLLDLLGTQRRAGGVAPGRVADHPGEVADQELNMVAEVLKVAQLVDDHRVAEMEVGSSRVHAELHPEPAAGLELANEVVRDEQLVGPALDDGELVVEVELRHAAWRLVGLHDAATLRRTTIGKAREITAGARWGF